MQALGNDFVVIDATKQSFALSSEQIQRLGDRHRGVGFDQLLVIEPSRDIASDFYYRIFNADGGEVAQCGNGARCVALYIKSEGLCDRDEIVLQTQEAELRCRMLGNNQVSVSMSPPKFEAAEIPFDPSQSASVDLEFGVVNVGNPHAVIVVDEINADDLVQWGAALASDARFPEGVNVSAVVVKSRDAVVLRVFERGVGETEACGSAACAVMVLGYQQGWLDSHVTLSQPGGDLKISWQGTDSLIEMQGPAEFVFLGEYRLL